MAAYSRVPGVWAIQTYRERKAEPKPDFWDTRLGRMIDGARVDGGRAGKPGGASIGAAFDAPPTATGSASPGYFYDDPGTSIFSGIPDYAAVFPRRRTPEPEPAPYDPREAVSRATGPIIRRQNPRIKTISDLLGLDPYADTPDEENPTLRAY